MRVRVIHCPPREAREARKARVNRLFLAHRIGQESPAALPRHRWAPLHPPHPPHSPHSPHSPHPPDLLHRERPLLRQAALSAGHASEGGDSAGEVAMLMASTREWPCRLSASPPLRLSAFLPLRPIVAIMANRRRIGAEVIGVACGSKVDASGAMKVVLGKWC
jgi:hypothetical protein